MIKRLLFSAVAATAMAFSANAAELDILPTCGSGGWGSTSYDAATHTITYEGSWEGRGWWFNEGEGDFANYDEFVLVTEETTIGYNLVVQYRDKTYTDTSISVPAGRNGATVPLDPNGKADVQQIYIQSSAPGTIVLKAAYLRNEVEVDPNEPVVLFEGSKEIDWWGNAVDITAGDAAAAKLVAGDKLVIEYTAGADNGFKAIYVDASWGGHIMPFMTKLEGYQPEYETINLPTDKNEISFTLDEENVEIFLNTTYHNVKLCGDKVTITKVSIVHAAAGIADITTDENAPVEFFNLQGVRIAEPAAGQIVIRRQGNKVSKVFVK